MPTLWIAIALILISLTAGTVYRVARLRSQATEYARERLASMVTWWGVAIFVALAATFRIRFAAPVMAMISCIAFREFAALSRPFPLDGRIQRIGFAFIVVTYLGVIVGGDVVWLLSTGIVSSLTAASFLIHFRPLSRFTPITASFLYAMMITTTLPATSILLLRNDARAAGATFLFLVVVTEINDIAAALIGRRVGSRFLAPRLSPNKTQEGLLGGFLAAVLLASFIGPELIEISIWQAALAGALIGLTGTLGDLHLSAVKRCAGVKDSGAILPGHGGILDRLNSLTFSAPAFYLLVQLWNV